MATNKLDCIICLDTTGSMGNFCSAIGQSVPEIFQILRLTDVFNRIKIVTYEDYGDGSNLYRETKWCTDLTAELSNFVLSLRAGGGGDAEEAQKTAFNRILNDTDRSTLVIHFTDAPPHPANMHNNSNYTKEKEAHTKNQWEFDWVKLANKMAAKNITVYNIINTNSLNISSYYILLSERTHGEVLYITSSTKEHIAYTTISLCLALMGQETTFQNTYQFNYQTPSIDKCQSETKSAGYLPSNNVSRATVNITPNSAMNINMRNLLIKFRTSTDYSDVVFKIFDNLISGTKIVSLTTNPIFGQMWREICKRKDDHRREQLLLKLDDALRNLERSDKNQYTKVREWISESYNQAEDIMEEIKAASSQTPCLILRNNNRYTPQDIIEVSRSCNPHILHIICDLITELEIVKDNDQLPFSDDIPMYIPLSLPINRIFSLLPHLMAQGCLFSSRTAITMAMVVKLTNNVVLQEQATQFLENMKGKWFDVETPENYSAGFIKLALKLKECLTAEEIELFTKLQHFLGLMINKKTCINVRLPYIANKTRRADNKIKCECCNKLRSSSLITDNKCALCHCNYDHVNEPCSDNESIWCECRTCHSHYAVIRPELLNITPKCYYCRELNEDGSTHSKKCKVCRNLFIVPTVGPSEFTCAQCQIDPSKSVEDFNVTVEDIFTENRTEILDLIELVIDDDINPFSGHSSFKMKDKIKTKSQSNIVSNYKYKGKEVLNSEEVGNDIHKWITSGRSEYGMCMLCFEDKPKKNLLSVCGHRKCQTVACNECIESWYGITKPGHIVFSSRLCCPFCKCNPIPSIYRKFNRNVMALLTDIKNMNSNWYYGWCLKCYKLKQAIECVCAQELPEITNFVCDDCKALPTEGKPCPGCGIEVIKTGGCNHMKCTVNECNTDWCYICSYVGHDSGNVYDHMHREHGGYFTNWLNGENEDYDSDDDFEDMFGSDDE